MRFRVIRHSHTRSPFPGGHVFALMMLHGVAQATRSLAGVLVLAVLLSLTGCQTGEMLLQRTRRDALSSFDAERGYVILEAEHMRAVTRPGANGAIVLSTQEAVGGTRMEYPAGRPFAGARPYADRLLVGTTGVLDVMPSAWQVIEEDADFLHLQRDYRLSGERDGAFALSLERDVRLHGRSALDGFMTGSLPDDVEVSGYESRNFFMNPGPLPWSRRDALPYIRVEGNLWRSQDTLLLLHVRPGRDGVLARQLADNDASSVDAVLLGWLRAAGESRLTLSPDFVLPRLAVLDREAKVLTLIAYTPPLGNPTLRDDSMVPVGPEIVLSELEDGGRWLRVVSTGSALPLATGGSMRHHRQTFHVKGDVDALLPIAAAFCRLPEEDVRMALEDLDLQEPE